MSRLYRTMQLRTRTVQLRTRTVQLRTRTVQLRARTVELRARKIELGARTVELRTRTMELRTRKIELRARKIELGARTVELGARTVDLPAPHSQFRTRHSEFPCSTCRTRLAWLLYRRGAGLFHPFVVSQIFRVSPAPTKITIDASGHDIIKFQAATSQLGIPRGSGDVKSLVCPIIEPCQIYSSSK
jgi:hypothetical protein